VATHGDDKVAEGDADPVAEDGGDDGDGSLIPEGGLVLRRGRPLGAAGGDATGEDAAGGYDADGLPNEGCLVVDRCYLPPLDVTTDDPTAASLVEVAGDETKKTEIKSQPTVKPSTEAVVAVKAVLFKMLVRSDCKDVLRKMLMDGVVTLTRMHSGQSTNPGVITATDAEPDWSSLRNLSHNGGNPGAFRAAPRQSCRCLGRSRSHCTRRGRRARPSGSSWST